MNYPESSEILKIVKKSNSAVLMCHEGPDTDSVLSCLVLKSVLAKLGLRVDIYCVEDIGPRNRKLDKNNQIKISDAAAIKYDQYDVLFALDVNELSRLGIRHEIIFDGICINIDHHEGNDFSCTKIIDQKSGSTCSVLYSMFKDWNHKLDTFEINSLLIGAISDTGVFQFAPISPSFIFRTVSSMIEDGADYEYALLVADQSNDIEIFKYISEAINTIEIDEKYRFAYSIMNYESFKKYKHSGARSRDVSDNIIRKIDNIDFGVVMLGDEKGGVKVSIRTRTPRFYVLELVQLLGGGGHQTGGGAYVKLNTFESSCEHVINECRKFASLHQ